MIDMGEVKKIQDEMDAAANDILFKLDETNYPEDHVISAKEGEIQEWERVIDEGKKMSEKFGGLAFDPDIEHFKYTLRELENYLQILKDAIQEESLRAPNRENAFFEEDEIDDSEFTEDCGDDEVDVLDEILKDAIQEEDKRRKKEKSARQEKEGL